MRLLALCGLGLTSAAMLLGRSARAEIPLYLVSPTDIKLDGMLDEWGSGSFPTLSVVMKGSRGQSTVRMGLAYDKSHIYVAGNVIGPAIKRTKRYADSEDHAELVLSFPDAQGRHSRVYEVKLFAGVPGELEGHVRAVGLGKVNGARIVEAPSPRGYTFEAKIPWSLFPPAGSTRVNLRGDLRYYQGGKGACVMAVSGAATAAELPSMPNAAEQSVAEGVARQAGTTTPSFDVVANVVGDAMNERVMLLGRYLVVLGPSFRKGTEYLWSDLGVDMASGNLPLLEVRDLTGDNRAEIVLKKRISRSAGWRELLQVLSLQGGNLSPLFEHETGIHSPTGTIENRVAFVPSGNRVGVEISLGSHSGYDASNFHEPMETDRPALLLPWGTVQSRTYVWDGTSFAKSKEVSKEAGSKPVARGEAPIVTGAPVPRPPTEDELLDRVFALYKKDQNIGSHATPTFDFVTDVAADKRVERVICYGRDLVVFGKGFRQGRGYVSLSMPQFATDSDISHVSAYDLTGDGRAEILVRGVQRAAAPEELGGGELVREVLFVYTVTEQGLKRVFAAETALSLGSKRIHSLVALIPRGRATVIELRPGRAIGWDKSTWPYRQDTELVSGLEPLQLPWTADASRFHFANGAFTR